jgi:hypothetical protein
MSTGWEEIDLWLKPRYSQIHLHTILFSKFAASFLAVKSHFAIDLTVCSVSQFGNLSPS